MMISQNDGTSLKGLASPNATVRKLAVQPLQLDGSVDSDIRSKVDAINIKRRAYYTEIAAKRGAKIEEVAA